MKNEITLNKSELEVENENLKIQLANVHRELERVQGLIAELTPIKEPPLVFEPGDKVVLKSDADLKEQTTEYKRTFEMLKGKPLVINSVHYEGERVYSLNSIVVPECYIDLERSEYMNSFNESELAFLELISDEYRWIAKDEADDTVMVYVHKPVALDPPRNRAWTKGKYSETLPEELPKFVFADIRWAKLTTKKPIKLFKLGGNKDNVNSNL